MLPFCSKYDWVLMSGLQRFPEYNNLPGLITSIENRSADVTLFPSRKKLRISFNNLYHIYPTTRQTENYKYCSKMSGNGNITAYDTEPSTSSSPGTSNISPHLKAIETEISSDKQNSKFR